jgi:hypothetical protein
MTDLTKLAARIDAAIKRSAKGVCRDGDKQLVLKAAKIGLAAIAQHTPGEDGLLPCPFCNVKVSFRKPMQVVHLKNDCALSELHYTDDDCEFGGIDKHKWNRRALSTAIDEMMEGE